MWFFEHTLRSNVKLNLGKGCIPRYLNWNLTKNWRRDTFQSQAVDFIRTTDVSDKPLVPTKAEMLIFEIGFIAAKYIIDLKDEGKLREDNDKFKLLSEVAHIYMKFGLKPCSILSGKVQKQRFLSLDYLGMYKKQRTIDDIPVEDLLEFADELEQEYLARKILYVL